MKIDITAIPPSPWEKDGYVAEHVETSRQFIAAVIHSESKALGGMTIEQRKAICRIAECGMSYAWMLAMLNHPNAPWFASQKAAVAAKTKSDAKHAQVRAAYERAAGNGEDVRIEALARACGVSRATAYRAMQKKPRKGKS